MIQLRHIRAFLAVAESGSIRLAARRLGISQPSLTKTLHETEQKLGVQLIARSTQGSLPTEHGRLFLARARTIDGELRRAQEEMDQIAGRQGGTVSIGLSAGASLLLGGEALVRFWKTHPTARVRALDGLFESLLTGVREGRFDFSVGGLPASDTSLNLSVEPLFRHRIVPVVGLGHPLAQAQSLGELADADWALTNDEPAFLDLIADRFAANGLPPPRIVLTAQSFSTLMDVVPRTGLVLALPRSFLAIPAIGRTVAPIPIREKLPETVVALVSRAGVPMTPLAARLADEFRRIGRRISRENDPA